MDVITESNRIQARLRSCETMSDIDQVADEERETVKAMSGLSEEGKTQAIIVANAKAYYMRLVRGEI